MAEEKYESLAGSNQHAVKSLSKRAKSRDAVEDQVTRKMQYYLPERKDNEFDTKMSRVTKAEANRSLALS